MGYQYQTNTGLPLVDKAHSAYDFANRSPMARDVWVEKYRWLDEVDIHGTFDRVADAIFAKDTSEQGIEAREAARAYMHAGLLMPAGRILAGAGTDKVVTLLNCFVNGTIKDNMRSIMDHVSYAVLTMQQGGGMGTAFETIRPANAVLKRTGPGSRASGPLPFMDMWNTAGITVESAGGRRGAQMGTMSDTHPDMPAFVIAKQTPGRLTNFNVSVLISDAFMAAKDDDAEWPLFFHIPPVDRDPALAAFDFVDEAGVQQYVYSVWKARELWEMITRNTYEYSEPGVIFIDRVNERNNLWYCEIIRATNPCGEQPLPPHNACDLGHIVLARLVRNPFKANAEFDFNTLKLVARTLLRFLDNVWDVTRFPLELQEEECLSKRRTGLGYTGLADTFAMMGIRYGSRQSHDLLELIESTITEAVYNESVDLAIEKGSFPLFDADKYLAPNTFAGSKLPHYLKERIRHHGIRNGVLLTKAPTGTSSIVFGNPQGSLEPFFSLEQKRNILQQDKTTKPYIEYPYAVALWWDLIGNDQMQIRNDRPEYPPFFVSVSRGDISLYDHVLIQAKAQEWTDAAISKTINIPQDMPYEDFVRVYDLAYIHGCKGCTTYRPSAMRGSVLEDASAKPAAGGVTPVESGTPSNARLLADRPDILHGSTYKIKWPRRESSLYLTINSDHNNIPYECFITGKDGSAMEWTTSLSLMITGHFRKGGDIDFVGDELMQINSINDAALQYDYDLGRKRFFNSLPAYIGHLIQYHLKWLAGQVKGSDPSKIVPPTPEVVLPPVEAEVHGQMCPKCRTPSLIKQEGCDKCLNCGYSHCG